MPDEETGGALGTGALAAAGLLADDTVGMLLPEPTSGVVWNANRGAITLEVTVRGRAAHVALQHQGTNAVERALPLLARLFDVKRELDARGGSILLVGGRVDAGSNFNVVPAECRFTIDRRTDPGEDFDAEKQRLAGDPRRGAVAGDRPRGPDDSGRAIVVHGPRTARSRSALSERGRGGRPATRRRSRCAPACSKRGSTPSAACRRSPTVRASSRCRTGRRSS